MIARRINLAQLKRWNEIDPVELPYTHDPEGDGAWVDFLWAPGQKMQAVNRLEASGINWVGWQHRTTCEVHIKTLAVIRRAIAIKPVKSAPIRLI
jgi:hypothetical protein